MHSYHACCAEHIRSRKTLPISLRYKMEMRKTKDRIMCLSGNYHRPILIYWEQKCGQGQRKILVEKEQNRSDLKRYSR
jgi:hypothetical protein